MKLLWEYSEIKTLINQRPNVKDGIVLDTNILISLTYDFDKYFDSTNDFFNNLTEDQIPLFCNISVKSEFLEIQRRIIFTEALLSFESATKLAILPIELAKKLASIRSNQQKREKDNRDPLRLSDAEIKAFKQLMIKETKSSGNLWTEFCAELINRTLHDVWNKTVEQFGFNFLSLRYTDKNNYMLNPPSWDKVIDLMSFEGLSSSDAMILNMYYSTKFSAIVSNDFDIGHSVFSRNDSNELCIFARRLELN